MATTVARVTISRQLEGAPGVSPAVYRIDVDPGAWMLGSDGVPPKGLSPKLKVYRTQGTETEDVTGCWAVTLSDYKLKVIADGNEVALRSGYVIPTTDNKLNGYKSIRIEFYSGCSTASIGGSNEKLEASFDCSISEQGLPGDPGLPGPVRAPLRITNWANDPIGMEFYTGDNPDDLYTDIIYEVSETNILWYQCIQNCTKAAGDTPTDKLLNQQKCFRSAERHDFIATDIFLAQQAIIKNLIAEGVVAGIPHGQRIEIQPDSMDMKIYDSSGRQRVRFSGEIKTVESVVPTSESWSDGIPGQTKSIAAAISDIDSGWLDAGKITMSNGGATKVSCQLDVVANKGHMSQTGSGTTALYHLKYAIATAEVRVVSGDEVLDESSISIQSPFPDADLSQKADSRNVTLNVNVPSNAANKTLKFQYRLSIKYTTTNPNGDNASVEAMAKISNVSYGTAGADYNNAEYFANGWILSSASNDYVLTIWDAVNGTNFIAENKHGYGLKITKDGIFGRKAGDTTWKSIQLGN
ncbi:MAG: hypothetical protein HDS16_04995 [Bacteroides sp.]|nr:hypothetical protein [Bacteroides sp.]